MSLLEHAEKTGTGGVVNGKTRLADVVIALALAALVYRGALFAVGDIGLSYEWYVPSTPELLRVSVWNTLHAWTPLNFGMPDVYPTYFFAIWWQAIAGWLGANGAFVTRAELVGCFVAAFTGFAALMRHLIPSSWHARTAATVYACAPYLYYHAAGGHLPAMQSFAVVPWLLATAIAAPLTLQRAFVLALFGALIPQPQALLLLPLLILAVVAPLRGWRTALEILGTVIGGLLVANAYWILPAALALHQTVQTLSTAQAVNIAYGLSHSIVQRDAAATILLREYNGTFSYPDVDPRVAALLTIVAFAVPILALYGILVAGRRLRVLALALGTLIVAISLLFTGPHDAFEAPIVWAYLHVPAMSFFKENYHLAFALTLAYAMMCGLGLQALTELGHRMLATALAILAVVGWGCSTAASGDLGGWVRPVPAARMRADIAVPLERRNLVLPGVMNLRPAARNTATDGVDGDLAYLNGFGTWLAMPNIGAFLLHRATDDRLGELPDVASAANVGWAIVRDQLRSNHDLDNPFAETTVLLADGFRRQGGPPPHAPQFETVEDPHAATVRRVGSSATGIAFDVVARAHVPAAVRINALHGSIGIATLRNRHATYGWYETDFPTKPATTLVFGLRPGRSRLTLRGAEGSLSVSVTPVRTRPATDQRVDPHHPALVPIDALERRCPQSWYSEPLVLVHDQVGGGVLVYDRPLPSFSSFACPGHVELYRPPYAPFGATQTTAVVLYDGDLTALRALRSQMGTQRTLPDDLVRIDDWWSLQRSSDRPRIDGIVGTRGFEPLARPACTGCVLSEPPTPTATTDSLLTGWIGSGMASNWAFIWDVLDTGSVFHYAASESIVPLTFPIACRPGDRLYLDLTLSTPTTVVLDGRPIILAPSAPQDATRRVSQWYDLGRRRCATPEPPLTITASAPGLTVVYAALRVPPGAAPAAPILSYDLVASGTTELRRPLLLDLPQSPYGNGVARQTARPQLRLVTHTRLLPTGRRTALPFARINPAVYRLEVGDLPRASLIEVDEAFNGRWQLYRAPSSRADGLFGWCIAFRACPQLRWAHLSVNGYANGWIVPPHQGGAVYAVFEPEIWFSNVANVTTVSVVVLAGLLLVPTVRRLRKARPRA